MIAVLARAIQFIVRFPDATESLYHAMESAKRACDFDADLAESAESLTESYYNIEDACEFYRQYRDRIDSDPLRLNEAEERLDRILRMGKKYHSDCDGMIALLSSMEQDLATFEDFDDNLTRLRKEEDDAFTLKYCSKPMPYRNFVHLQLSG